MDALRFLMLRLAVVRKRVAPGRGDPPRRELALAMQGFTVQG
jgi:hypothetical protein